MTDRPWALFLSPHLDDVAFSCAGTLAALRRNGWRTAVATVFTASVSDPSGFALACQLDKGLPPDIDYLALRRAEDAAFGRAVGADAIEWLGLPEAPHRGYDSAPALFAGVRPDDLVATEIAKSLVALDDRFRPALVFAPRGIGNHADHLQVIRAVLSLPALAARRAWYRDLPYAARFPNAPGAHLPDGLIEVAVPLEPADLTAKLAGSACYTTQIGFQFGDEAVLRRQLGDFAATEASRLGLAPGHAETFRVPSAVAERLGEVFQRARVG